MASSWPSYQLSDIAEVTDYVANGSFEALRTNVRYRDLPDYAILVRLADFNAGWKGPFVYVDRHSYDFLKKSALVPGDVVIANVGANAGTVFEVPKLDKPMTLGPNAVLIRPKGAKQYFSYYFRSPLGQHQLHSIISGSAQPKFNKTDLRRLEVPLPPLSEQRAIARILGTLDDKIELNRRMNETLEAMARALFKSWFVDFDPVHAKAEGRQPVGMDAETAALFPNAFEESELGEIPRGWQVMTLDAVSSYVLGGDWGVNQPSDVATEPALCIRGADISSLQRGELGEMPVRYIKRSSLAKRALLPGDLAIEISGGSPTQSTGRSVLITEELLRQFKLPLVCSNFCRMLRLNETATSSFTYLWLRWLYSSDALLQYENGTTGIKNLAFTTFSSRHPLLLPPLSVLLHFELFVGPFLRAQVANGEQAVYLAAIRDTLLPKLLSGEIQVKDAEKVVEEVIA